MAETSYRYGASRFGSIQWGGLQAPLVYPTWHYVYFITTSISLDWARVSGATYNIQVSSTPDFSGTLMVDTAVAGSGHTFTDTGTNDTKRWWRWQVVGEKAWREIGSYWLNTSGANNISVGRNIWKMFDPDDVTDIYILPLFPNYQIVKSNIDRLKTRNRLGTLLSEYLTSKSSLMLDYTQNGYMKHVQFREHRRFNEEIKTLFITTFKDSDDEMPVPNIWKVQYQSDPALTMISHGRQDLMTGSINFEEV